MSDGQNATKNIFANYLSKIVLRGAFTFGPLEYKIF